MEGIATCCCELVITIGPAASHSTQHGGEHSLLLVATCGSATRACGVTIGVIIPNGIAVGPRKSCRGTGDEERGENAGETYSISEIVRPKGGGRGLTGSIATGRLLCKKGAENLVENSTIELPRNLYSLYREYTISEEARNARCLAETSEIGWKSTIRNSNSIGRGRRREREKGRNGGGRGKNEEYIEKQKYHQEMKHLAR
jgi:hypothetical protein